MSKITQSATVFKLYKEAANGETWDSFGRDFLTPIKNEKACQVESLRVLELSKGVFIYESDVHGITFELDGACYEAKDMLTKQGIINPDFGRTRKAAHDDEGVDLLEWLQSQ